MRCGEHEDGRCRPDCRLKVDSTSSYPLRLHSFGLGIRYLLTCDIILNIVRRISFGILRSFCCLNFGWKVSGRVGEFVETHDVILFRGFIISA